MKICPNCGKKTLPFHAVLVSLPVLRLFLKPARCKECNGYYKAVITKKYLKDSLFYTILLSLLLIFAALLYVKLSGFTYDNSVFYPIFLIVLLSAVISFIAGLAKIGTESCNHNYELLPHENDFKLEISSASLPRLFENKTLTIRKDEFEIPVIVKSISADKNITVVTFGFINSAFYETDKLSDGDEITVILGNTPYITGIYTTI